MCFNLLYLLTLDRSSSNTNEVTLAARTISNLNCMSQVDVRDCRLVSLRGSFGARKQVVKEIWVVKDVKVCVAGKEFSLHESVVVTVDAITTKYPERKRRALAKR